MVGSGGMGSKSLMRRMSNHKRVGLEEDTMRRKPYGTFRDLEKAIRLQCIECFGGVASEVEHCTSPNCSLYPWRLGARTKRKGGPGNPEALARHRKQSQ